MFFCKKLLFALYWCDYILLHSQKSRRFIKYNACYYSRTALHSHQHIYRPLDDPVDGSLYASVSDNAVSGVLCGRLYFSGIFTAHQFPDPEAADISPFSEKYGKLFSRNVPLYSDRYRYNRSGKTDPETHASSRLALLPESFRTHRRDLYNTYYRHQRLRNFKSVES